MKYLFLILIFIVYTPSIKGDTLKFVFSDFPPFEYVDDDDAVGMNVEIIKEVCRRLNITPIFEQLPWKRALEEVKVGEADAIFSLFKNDERLKYYNYPEEKINSVKMVLITNIENEFSVANIEDLKEKRVGTYLGSSYGEKFDECRWVIRDDSPTYEGLVRKQAIGRTEVSIIDERVAKYWSDKLNLKGKFRRLQYIVSTNPTYVAFSKIKSTKNGRDWSQKFSVILKKMERDGFIKSLEERYSF